jgi:hypothetical protein
MPGSSFMYEKRRLSEFTLNPGNEDHKTSQAVDLGLRTPSTGTSS